MRHLDCGKPYVALGWLKTKIRHLEGEKPFRCWKFNRRYLDAWWKATRRHFQQTQNICITFIQRRPNVFDVRQHCIIVIQMFCVVRLVYRKPSGDTWMHNGKPSGSTWMHNGKPNGGNYIMGNKNATLVIGVVQTNC